MDLVISFCSGLFDPCLELVQCRWQLGLGINTVFQRTQQHGAHRYQIRRSWRSFHKVSITDPTIRKTFIQVNTSLHHGSAMGHRLVDKSWLECRSAAATLTGHITWWGRWSSHCGSHSEQRPTQFFSWHLLKDITFGYIPAIFIWHMWILTASDL
jgi:hypothetical protein